MIKNIFFIALILISSLTFGQKPQRIGYIDMDYILENVPEYTKAQSQLNDKVKTWQIKLDKLSDEIDLLNTSLSNEKALLTKEMIIEREEDILIKKQELKRLQDAYFGPSGDMFRLRTQLVEPVQDQVFNAIQDIAVRKKYDFVFDKTSDLLMLYSNSKYDISELVLNAIVKNRKKQTLADKKSNRTKKGVDVETTVPVEDEIIEAEEINPNELVDVEGTSTDPEDIKLQEAQKKADEKEAKRAALKERIRIQQEAREKLRDSLKKVSEDRRAAKLKEIEERNKKREEIINEEN